MTKRAFAAALFAGATVAVLSLPLTAGTAPDSGPIARYDMRAGTSSGFLGGRGMSAMSMMFGGGGGGGAQHELLLRLGSAHAPDKGKPKADHFMPPVAKLGKSVALVTPAVERAPSDELPMQQPNEKPTGRILIYWGCGEHAPKGQPVVIDLARLSAGEMPQGLWTGTIPRDWGPTLENSTTFGRWPADDGKSAKPDSSLLGEHRIVSNYAPEISFSLTQDFMGALTINSRANPSGSALLTWNKLPEATGYLATLFGGKQTGGRNGDIVMWSSSESREFGGGLSDWLAPDVVARLVKQMTVMGPAASSCTIPMEVLRDAPDFRMGTLTAFGPEQDFAYPPKPADPKARWDLQWTARVRYRSQTGWMEAQGMTMGTAQDGEGAQQQQPQQQQCKPRKGGLFGGVVGSVLGGAGGC